MVSSCPEQRTAAATTTATATPSTARGADRQRGRHHIQQLQLQPHQQRLRQRLGIGKPGSSGTSSATPAATAKLVKSRVTVVSSTTHVASATTASVSSTTPTASSSSALKLAQPLYKHRFYLEIKNHSVAAKIEQKIKHLGGKVELFLDKEVTHVISDREGYVDVKGTISPKTLLSNQSSTTPTAYGHGGDRTPSARPKSRVRAILEKARNTPTQAENDLFVEAEKLGISIWTTDKANEWLNKVAASVKISKQKKFYELKGNFIKFESFDRQNRPVFKELPLWPYLNLRGYLGDLAVITKPPPARTAGGTSKQPQQSVVAGRQPVTPLPAATLTQERNRAPAGPGAGDAVAAGLCQRNMTRKSSRIGTVASLAASRQPPPHLSGRKQNGTINPLAASEADDQPGYCELCRIAFPHQDDHLHSEPHTKNAREHAGFLQLDELIADGATHLDSFLKINNFKENGKLPLIKMPRTRTASLSDKLKAAPVSPTVSEFGNGRGRPRRHAAFTNSYLEIGVDDEKPEGARESRELRSSKSHTAPLKEVEPESPDTWNSGRPKRSCILRPKRTSADERLVVDNRTYYKVEVLNAKLRSSTAPSAKENVHLTPTRISPVPSPGLSNDREPMERHRRITTPARTTEPAPHSPRESAIVTPASTRTLTTDKRSVSEGGSKNAGSIVVKFKRMRSSELRQLNNEAVNFLFPRKDESSSEDDIDENCPDSTVETIKDVEQSILISSEDESVVEDASAQDSRSSSDAAIFITPVPKNSLSPVVEEEEEQEEGSIERPQRQRGKQRRRTHAQAFITDNQQYYKFETPSSRLRYQGSTIMSSHQLSSGGEHAIPPMKTPRRNGETPSVVPKRRRSVVTFADTPEEKNVVTNTPAFVSGDMANGINSSPDTSPNMSLPLDELKFSFEQQPKTEPWYEPFTRQDQGLEIYKTFGESQFSKPFRMPYEMGRLPPLNPRHCFDQYELLVKHLLECPGVNDESAPATPSCGDSITPTEGTSSIDGESSNSRPLSTLDDDESNAAAALDRVNTTNCAAETDDSADSAPINDQHVDGGSSFDVETVERIRRRKKRRKAAAMLMANNKNPRKSPRQHASTLAILSSLLQQRKRRELNRSKSDHDDSKLSESDTTLATISEEGSMLTAPTTDDVDGRSAASSRLSSAAGDTTLAKADIELAQLLDQLHRIESALSTNDADDAELDLDLDVQPYHGLDLLDSAEPALLTHYRTDPIAILQDYHRQRDELANTPGACVSGRGKRTFASGRKPGRRPKKRRTNMTGWPNKNRRIYHNTTATTTSTTPVLVVKTEVLDDEDDDEEADAMMDHDGNSNCTADDADDLPSPLCSPRVRVEVDSSLNHDEDIISENNEKVLSVSDSAIAIKSLEVHSSSAEHKPSRLCQNHQDDYIKPASTKSVRLISVDSATDRVVDLAQWETAERALNEAVSNSYNDNGNDDEDDHSDNESERVNRRRSIVVISNSSAAAASSLSMSSSPHRNMQPVVRVAKLDTSSPIRTPMSMKTTPRKSTPPSSTLVTPSPLQRARRRMPASPRSPRVLRKPRGRWYRER